MTWATRISHLVALTLHNIDHYLSTTTVRQGFLLSAQRGQTDIMVAIFEKYASALRDGHTDIIQSALWKSSNRNDSKTTVKLLEIAADTISHDNMNTVFSDALKHNDAIVIAKVLELARKPAYETLDLSISYAFSYAANRGFTDTLNKIWELAADKISTNSINSAFQDTAQHGHTETLNKIWELAADKIDNDSISSAFKYAAWDGHTDTLVKIWELDADKIDNDSISSAFKYAAKHGHTETLSKIWELAADKIDNDIISLALKNAASNGRTETLSKILELAAAKIDNDGIASAFEYAASTGHIDILVKILEAAADRISDADILKGVEISIEKSHLECTLIMLELAASRISTEDANQLAQKTSLKAIANSDIKMMKLLLKHDLFYQHPDTKIIGFANYVGQWSRNILDYLAKKDGSVAVIPLTLEDTQNQKLMAIINGGFVLPGGHDSFYRKGETSLSYLSDDDIFHTPYEYDYQNIINYAKEHHMPVLGLCSGAQHLILNAGGSVAQTKTLHNGSPHTLKAIEGTIIHFMAMNEAEQSLAISQGYFPAMEFLINTQHNYAGVNGKIGNLELGGLSDEGVVEAVANTFYQLGYQFHPEYMYYNMEDKAFGRNNNLLKNIFKFFLLDKEHIDMPKMHEYMLAELHQAFAEATCPVLEDLCPAPEGFARDIFAEAIIVAHVD